MKMFKLKPGSLLRCSSHCQQQVQLGALLQRHPDLPEAEQVAYGQSTGEENLILPDHSTSYAYT